MRAFVVRSSEENITNIHHRAFVVTKDRKVYLHAHRTLSVLSSTPAFMASLKAPKSDTIRSCVNDRPSINWIVKKAGYVMNTSTAITTPTVQSPKGKGKRGGKGSDTDPAKHKEQAKISVLAW